MNVKIFLKSIQDIDIKLMFCKSNFQWKLLAGKYEDAKEKVEDFYEDDVPEEIAIALETVKQKLVEKKGELPLEDLLV